MGKSKKTPLLGRYLRKAVISWAEGLTEEEAFEFLSNGMGARKRKMATRPSPEPPQQGADEVLLEGSEVRGETGERSADARS